MDGCASLAQRGKFGKFDNTEAQRHRGTETDDKTKRKKTSVSSVPWCFEILQFSSVGHQYSRGFDESISNAILQSCILT